MDTPDKIYIADHNANVETGYFSRNKDDVFTQEYIRKDALMEWLKPEKDISFPDDYERGCIDGRNGLRGELIDKLNSM